MAATIYELRPRKTRGQSRRPVTDDEAAQRAWGHVLSGFERAIAELGPGHPERRSLAEMQSLVSWAARGALCLQLPHRPTPPKAS